MKFDEKVKKDWEKNFKKLIQYKQKFGDCNVPHEWKEDPSLANWVKIQRKVKNQLPKNFKERLIAIDFDFSDHQYPWEEKFIELQSFAKEYGHAHVPATDSKYEELHDWLIQQIKNQDFLSNQRKQKLDYLGIVWEYRDLREWKWQEMYLELKEFYDKHGHSKVPQKWDENRRLSNWVTVQRRTYSEGKMKPDRKKKLDQLDFVYDFRELFEDQWEDKLNRLNKFKEEHGHTKVPLTYEDQQLAGWVDRQRTLKQKDRLLPEREKKLNEVGFIWDCTVLQEQQWEERFQQLLEYKKKYGDCFVPVNWKKNRQLGIWVSTQRTLEKKKKMDPEKKKRLDEIGFIWKNKTKYFQDKRYDEIWEKNYQKLIAYKKKYGKLQVSVQIDRPLQRWTCAQRKHYQIGKLSKDRIEKLNKIGFAWDLHEAYWMKRYKQVVEFKKRFGHTRVPWGWRENPKLGQWVSRTRLNKKDLTREQIALLDKIDFNWKIIKKKMVPWMEMYQHLVDFKKAFGHTRVPVNWKKNKRLGKWSSRIRSEQDKLHPERKRLLEKIDFDWEKRKGRFSRKLTRELMAEST